jgi:hypothetical protein
MPFSKGVTTRPLSDDFDAKEKNAFLYPIQSGTLHKMHDHFTYITTLASGSFPIHGASQGDLKRWN